MSNTIKTEQELKDKIDHLLDMIPHEGCSSDQIIDLFKEYSQFSSPAVSDEEIEMLGNTAAANAGYGGQLINHVVFGYKQGFKSALKRGGETPVGEEEKSAEEIYNDRIAVGGTMHFNNHFNIMRYGRRICGSI